MPTIDQKSRPLLYAWVAHREWARRLASALMSESLERPTLDPSHCNFCFWLDQLRDTWGAEIEPLDHLHQQIHRLAESLFALQDSGEDQQAIDRLPELYAQRDALLEEIERLLDRARPYMPMDPAQ